MSKIAADINDIGILVETVSPQAPHRKGGLVQGLTP